MIPGREESNLAGVGKPRASGDDPAAFAKADTIVK